MSACRKTESQLSTEVAKTLMTHLTDGLRQRFGNVETKPLFARATLLDPRFKKKSICIGQHLHSGVNDVTGLVSRAMTERTANSMRSDNGDSVTPAEGKCLGCL